MKHRSTHPSSRVFRAWQLSLLTLIAVVLDQLTKLYAILYLKNEPPRIFFGGVFRIEYAENEGAFLSLMSSFPDEVRFWILTVLNGLVLVGLAVFLIWSKEVQKASFLPLALVVAGGVGNLIDRIRFHYVVDFLNLGIGNLRTGIFNIADMFITAGFLLMAWYMIFGPNETEEVPATSTPVAGVASTSATPPSPEASRDGT